MCSTKIKVQSNNISNNNVSHINSHSVLQPNRNRVPLLERRNSLKNPSSAAAVLTAAPPRSVAATPPASPKIYSPRQPAIKRSGNDPNGEKLKPPSPASLLAKKSKNSGGGGAEVLVVEEAGSIAAARREQVAIMQVQRKMRIAHYGRTKSAKYAGKVAAGEFGAAVYGGAGGGREEKRCSFVTANSDPIFVAYHDEEWGVPVHDDNMLFELLVLTGAQVGSDWTIVLKKRQEFRDAFAGFDVEQVSKYSEKKMISISANYGIELSQVRGAVDNSIRILEIKKQFGSFDKYLWAFVNHKPIVTKYKWCNKIPVKTSKSETISKDMVKRGFRFVGPTVVHSFMQAVGLTNDHLITCPRHLQCVDSIIPQRPSTDPAI